MPHFLTSHQTFELPGVAELEFARQFVNLLLLLHDLLLESAVCELELPFLVQRIDVAVLDPVEETRVFLQSNCFDRPVEPFVVKIHSFFFRKRRQQLVQVCVIRTLGEF